MAAALALFVLALAFSPQSAHRVLPTEAGLAQSWHVWGATGRRRGP
jgi:hypothetical protein